jgi:hypothetical protein
MFLPILVALALIVLQIYKVILNNDEDIRGFFDPDF